MSRGPERDHGRRARHRMLGLGLLLGLLVVSTSQARIVAGVEMPEQADAAGHVLTLRHTGLYERTIFNIDVYVWGLYLEDSAANPQQSLGQDSARQLRLQFKRDVSRERLAEGLRVLGGHSAMQRPGMQDALEQLVSALSGMRKGDELVITYIPGNGTTLSGDVQQQAAIPGEEFGEALFTAWLGWVSE